MLDSPFEFCKVCGGYVLLDQTQTECSHEHRCAHVPACPLRQFFTGIEFAKAGNAATESGRRKPGAAPAKSVT